MILFHSSKENLEKQIYSTNPGCFQCLILIICLLCWWTFFNLGEKDGRVYVISCDFKFLEADIFNNMENEREKINTHGPEHLVY